MKIGRTENIVSRRAPVVPNRDLSLAHKVQCPPDLHSKPVTLEAFSRSNVLEMHEVIQDSSRLDLETGAGWCPFRLH